MVCSHSIVCLVLLAFPIFFCICGSGRGSNSSICWRVNVLLLGGWCVEGHLSAASFRLFVGACWSRPREFCHGYRKLMRVGPVSAVSGTACSSRRALRDNPRPGRYKNTVEFVGPPYQGPLPHNSVNRRTPLSHFFPRMCWAT